MYVIRVDFPDDDKYAFVKNDDGEVRKFTDYSMAVEEARRYASAIVVEFKEDGNRIEWVGL